MKSSLGYKYLVNYLSCALGQGFLMMKKVFTGFSINGGMNFLSSSNSSSSNNNSNNNNNNNNNDNNNNLSCYYGRALVTG